MAAAEAVIPMPISTVDQMATSVVAHKKSAMLPMPEMYGRRMTVADEALFQLIGVLQVDDNSNLHSSDCQNTSDRYLRSGVHLQVPNDENWQDTQDPVTDT